MQRQPKCICVVLQVCLRYYEHEFVELACQCPAVVCCRCSPTQKAQIVTLLKQHTANRTCAIGEGWHRLTHDVAAAHGSVCVQLSPLGRTGWTDELNTHPVIYFILFWMGIWLKVMICLQTVCHTPVVPALISIKCWQCTDTGANIYILYFFYPQDGSQSSLREAPAKCASFNSVQIIFGLQEMAKSTNTTYKRTWDILHHNYSLKYNTK